MITTDQTLQAITDGFNAEGYDTPEKVTAFVQTSVRQMKLIVAQYELQALASSQAAAATAAQTARETAQQGIAALESSILTLVASQATPSS